MVVRKFEAPTLEQALAKVKHAMGPEALILSTSQKRNRWFQKPVVEVAAAIPAESSETIDEQSLSEVFPHRRKPEVPEEGPNKTETAANAARIAYGALQRPQLTRKSEPAPDQDVAFFENLGFEGTSAREFVRRIRMEFSVNDRNDESFMRKERAKLVAAGLKTLDAGILERRKSWVVVGEAGSGKTSTCVKLAAHLRTKGQPVCLVSADRRKLVGEQELFGYARLLGVPHYSIFQHNRKPGMIEIFDTPAIGFVQQEVAKELDKICRESSVLLVLDAGQRYAELMRSIAEAESLGPVGLFFTRVDVVRGAGVVYDVLRSSRLPLLGVSVGGGFRNSLQLLEPMDLASVLLKTHPLVQSRASA